MHSVFNKLFSYIPTGHSLQMDKLDTHEYFGADLKAAKCTVAIFINEHNRYRAVWSFGDWDTYGVEVGDWVTFEHTQTMRHTELVLVTIITAGNRHLVEGDSPKIPQWTLK